MNFIAEFLDAAAAATRERPNIDFALAAIARVLRLPTESPLMLFAIGRSIGWIGHAIEQYVEHRPAVEGSEKSLRRWSNNRERARMLTEREVREEVQFICRTVGVSADNLIARTDTLLAVAKIVTSYVNRLRFLAEQNQSHSAMLVGLNLAASDPAAERAEPEDDPDD